MFQSLSVSDVTEDEIKGVGGVAWLIREIVTAETERAYWTDHRSSQYW